MHEELRSNKVPLNKETIPELISKAEEYIRYYEGKINCCKLLGGTIGSNMTNQMLKWKNKLKQLEMAQKNL
jgi:hypothetical protein